MLPLGKQVLAHFHAPQRSALIRDPLDGWVLKQGHIKTDQLIRDGANGTEAPQTCYPGEHVVDPREQRGGKPAFGAPTVCKTRLPVLGMSLATTTPDKRALDQGVVNLVPAMRDFCGPHDFS